MAVLVHPIKPMLKVPGTMRLKLNYGKLLSSFAVVFNLRRYTLGGDEDGSDLVSPAGGGGGGRGGQMAGAFTVLSTEAKGGSLVPRHSR
jgi:hypothetical protein